MKSKIQLLTVALFAVLFSSCSSSSVTVQSGTGEPHIGLIPTMKTLAPPLKK